MHISSLLTLLSAPLLVFAAAATGPNAFKVPAGGYSATGGKALTLQWTPTTSGSVTLVLRSGSANDLDEGTIIVSSISNSGSYIWTPSNSITSGDDYTVEIVDDSDPSQVNYTPPFTLDTTTTEAHTTGVVTFTTPDSSIVSHAPTKTSKPTTSLPSSSVTLSIHNTFTSRASSSTSGLTEITHSPSTMPTGAGSSPSMAASTTSAGAAARATAMALGMVGVALGALAL